MTQTRRIFVAATFLALSACESVDAPLNKKGLYINAGAAIGNVRLAVPCPSPYECSVSPIIPLEETHALGWELGAGYRFTRFLSLQVDSLFTVSGGSSQIGVTIPPFDAKDQYPTAAEVSAGLILRPSLRADLPLSRRLSLYATYGLQYENISALTNGPTGAVQTDTTTCNSNSAPDCTPTTYQRTVTAINYFYHRDWHPSASVGVDWYFMNTRSLRLEYLPRRDGRISAITAGVSWHW
jgi:hypothetical protein